MIFRKLITILSLLLPLTTTAQQMVMPVADNDSLQIWLLTCSPGTEIHEYYGHTGLGIVNVTQQDSCVFNYGIFDYHIPNFAWHFMLGETDYTAAVCPMELFIKSYTSRGLTVTSQRLRLSSRDAHELYNSVITDCTSPAWTYRYNFIYDNCATRIRDKIVSCTKYDFINMQPDENESSLRDILHIYTKNYKWSEFGQDLLLGAEADKVATESEREFAPLYLSEHFDREALIYKRNKAYRFVQDVRFYNPETPIEAPKPFPISPMGCALILLGITLLISGFDLLRRKMSWGYDALLLLVEGLLGCLVTFIFLFSQHPTVGSNWLVLFFNPLPLIFLYEVIAKEYRGKRSRFLSWWGAFVFIFLLATPFIPQKISYEFMLMALSLPIRSLCGLLVEHRSKQRKR